MNKHSHSEKRLPFWKKWHYLIGYIPTAQAPETSEALHSKAAKINNTNEALSFVQARIESWRPFLEASDFSGFYSSVAYLLQNRYVEFLADVRSLALCYYPLIVAHLFCPPKRLHEQAVYWPPGSPVKLNVSSALSIISSDVTDCYLFGHTSRRWRNRYLGNSGGPFVGEVFKGLEYLAKLYYLKVDNSNIGQTVKKFLEQYTELDGTQREALWQFRCGIVHRGGLYNIAQGRIFRFGYTWAADDGYVIKRDDRVEVDFLEGEHYTVSLKGLLRIFEDGRRFIFRDMMTHSERYVLNESFYLWLRRHWTLQYLPSKEETDSMLAAIRATAKDAISLSSGKKPKRAEVVMACVAVPRWHPFRLGRGKRPIVPPMFAIPVDEGG